MKKILRTSLFGLTIFFLSSPSLSSATDLESNEDIATVLTPTRLKQAIADVPGSVTVITAQMIKDLGIRSIPDALRLVPGMAVTQVMGNDYRINYHGTNILVPRRMNVLIDGIAVYGQRAARVDWKSLPVVMDDIERIEVIRGPDAATYGANSMLAVINIITKHPDDTQGATLKVMSGSLNSSEFMARYGGRIGDSTSFRVTVDHEENDGFNYTQGFNYTASNGPAHDGARLDRVNFRAITQVSHDESIDVQAALGKSYLQFEYVDRSQQTFPDEDVIDASVSATWKKALSDNHLIQFQTYVTYQSIHQPFHSCVPQAFLLPQLLDLSKVNPNFANQVLAGKVPIGNSPQEDNLIAAAIAVLRSLGNTRNNIVCADTNQNIVQTRYDGEFQDTYVFSNQLRIVSGLGYRYDYVDSETFFGGSVSNNTIRAFANLEYKPSTLFTINAGGFLERDNLSGTSFSPKLAINTHLSDHSTIRLVASKAVRKPDLYEQRSYWIYPTYNYSAPVQGALSGHFYIAAISPGNLVGEDIFSKELGYNGNFPELGLNIDVKLFEDQLSHLISEKLENSNFKPTNNNSAKLTGAELGLSYRPTDKLSFNLSYAYLTNSATNVFEQTQYARNSGSAAVSYLSDNNWRTSFAYYGYGGDTDGQTFYGREDLIFQKDFQLGKGQYLTPSFTISHLDNKSSSYLANIGKPRVSSYNDAMQYWFALTYSF